MVWGRVYAMASRHSVRHHACKHIARGNKSVSTVLHGITLAHLLKQQIDDFNVSSLVAVGQNQVGSFLCL